MNAPDGRALGSAGTNRLAYLVAPVREPGGSNVQLVNGGLTEDPADVPGPFSNYLPAAAHLMQRSVSNESDTLVESQDWDFSAASGEHLALHVVFERGVANRSNPSDTMFYSAKDPSVFQISHQEQVLSWDNILWINRPVSAP